MAAAARPIVVLVPGFLGSAMVGNHHYFSLKFINHLSAAMRKRLGFAVPVIAVDTLPIGALDNRVDFLARCLLGREPGMLANELKTSPNAPFYLVGHSTGGLDAQLLMTRRGTPGFPAELEGRIRGVATLSAPHYGTMLAETPLAKFGQAVSDAIERRPSLTVNLLRSFRGLGAETAPWLLSVLAHTDYSQETREILSALLSHDGRSKLAKFIMSIATDQQAIDDLRPIRMVARRQQLLAEGREWDGDDECTFTCFVTGTPRPSPASPVYRRIWDDIATATHADPGFIDGLVGEDNRVPEVVLEDLDRGDPITAIDLLTTAILTRDKTFGDIDGFVPGLHSLDVTNDGVVSTTRQILTPRSYGGFLHSDHFEVIGYDTPGYNYFDAETGYMTVENYEETADAIARALVGPGQREVINISSESSASSS